MAKRKLSRRQLDRIGKRQAEDRARARTRSKQREPAKTETEAETEADSKTAGPPQAGLITANHGATLIVEAEGKLYRCTQRQNLPPLACGDRVIWQTQADGDGVVTALEPRRTLLSKPGYGGRMRPVAANIDLVAVVVAPRPELSESLLDRYLVVLEAQQIDALLVLNKVDLLDTDERRAELLARLNNYATIGYPLVLASSQASMPAGTDQLRQHLTGRAAILVGQSGVGKSSLTQALIPDLQLRTQALSAATGLGTHTTSTAMLYRMPDGGHLIDSPGVRSFEPGAVDDADLESGFIEFRPYLGRCRFSNCGHKVEPDCALRGAVEAGAIDARRLASYLQIKAARSDR